jgi:hypothetical protein
MATDIVAKPLAVDLSAATAATAETALPDVAPPPSTDLAALPVDGYSGDAPNPSAPLAKLTRSAATLDPLAAPRPYSMGAPARVASLLPTTAPQTLFVHGVPDPYSVRQGDVGDCYFVAAVVAVAKQNPQSIVRMIHDNCDGTYTVSFPDGHAATVTTPTADEILRHSSTDGDGIWMPVLEKAFCAIRERDGIFAFWPKEQPYDSGTAGLPAEGIHAMTGHSVDADFVALHSLDVTRAKLKDTLGNGRVITLASHLQIPVIQPSDIQGLPRDHVYSVMSYDPKSDCVTIRNPWGYQELVDADGNAANGVNDGVCSIPLANLHTYFAIIAYELAK